MKTKEGNKLIAEFMGLPCQHLDNDSKLPTYEDPYSGGYCEPIELSYEESWDWLMPVIKEIEERTDHSLTMNSGYSYWVKDGLSAGDEGLGFWDIKDIWNMVVEFINTKN